MTCYSATITLILLISFFTAHSMTTLISPHTIYNESLPLDIKYHREHILTAPIHISLIWYGKWPRSHKHIIREFINSLTSTTNPSPSVAEWWKPLSSYTDQKGSNVSVSITLGQQKNDRLLSQGPTLPYAWIGNSHKLCPGFCAFPFAFNDYTRGHFQPLKAPNGVVGVDGMISVITHELAEVATNPFATGWYAGDDPMDRIEVGDLCLAHYGMGAYEGVYVGKVLHDANGAMYN